MSRGNSSYVVCPHSVTSPIADKYGMTPSLPCGDRVPVFRQAPVMEFICARGHRFVSTERDVQQEAVR